MPFEKFPDEYEIDDLVIDEDHHANARKGWLIAGTTLSLMFCGFFLL